MDQLATVSAIAAEIDRLVVRGHELADGYPDKPPALANLTAFPQLLGFAALLLLERPLTRDDVARIVPYTPSTLIDALVENNISEGVVTEGEGALVLTDAGRAAAEGMADVQEAAIAAVWSSAAEHVEIVERLLTPVVQHGRTIDPPRSPSNFGSFAAVCDRPTAAGTVLRLVTAVRYWRSDAHARALGDADLRPFEAHALNTLWDTHRGLQRFGQGFPKPGSKGVASLEARGLARAGAITPDGVELREEIERATDRHTLPVYHPLDDPSLRQLLAALRALPS